MFVQESSWSHKLCWMQIRRVSPTKHSQNSLVPGRQNPETLLDRSIVLWCQPTVIGWASDYLHLFESQLENLCFNLKHSLLIFFQHLTCPPLTQLVNTLKFTQAGSTRSGHKGIWQTQNNAYVARLLKLSKSLPFKWSTSLVTKACDTSDKGMWQNEFTD